MDAGPVDTSYPIRALISAAVVGADMCKIGALQASNHRQEQIQQ